MNVTLKLKITNESQMPFWKIKKLCTYEPFASICPSEPYVQAKNPKLWKAPSCGEKQTERFMCFYVCVTKREGIFAHTLVQVHRDVMEKGRNATGRGRQEEYLPLFSFLLYLFVRVKKGLLNKDTKHSCAAEE